MDPLVLLLALGVGVVLAVLVSRSARSTRATRALADAKPSRDTIVPRIRTRDYLASLRRAGIGSDEDLPVTEPLAGELIIAYAFDTPDVFRMLAPRDLAALSLRADELRGIARKNLARKVVDEVDVREIGPLFQVVTGDHAEPSVLLSERYWRSRARNARGAIVASVPSRDALIFADSGDPLALELIVGVTDDAYRAAGPEALSRELLVWRDGRWAVYDGETETETDDEDEDEDEDE